MESSDNIVMDKVNNQSMKLYYGDIIKVISTNNPTFNEKIFFVKYVDDMKITLIEKTSFESYTLGLENDIIMDESIERIYLAYRQKDRGVCRVNGYVPGKVIEIHFMRSVKTIVTGRIVNLEEDMIELKIINPGSELHDKTIFIDFEYKGFPEKLGIYQINFVSDTFGFLESNKEKNQLDEDENNFDNNDDDNENLNNKEFQENNNNYETYDVDEHGIVTFVEKHIVQLQEHEYKYTIKEQKDDLIDDLLSLQTSRRDYKTMNFINRLAERFEQLVIHYSKMDDNYNVVVDTREIRGLQKSLLSPHETCAKFIIPIYDVKRNIFFETSKKKNDEGDDDDGNDDVDDGLKYILETENPNINLLDFDKDIDVLSSSIENTYSAKNTENRYEKYHQLLTNYFTSHVNKTPDVSSPKSINHSFVYIEGKNGIKGPVSNGEEIISLDYLRDTVTHNHLIDEPRGFMYLPESFVYQNNVYNDSVEILRKSLLNQCYIPTSSMLDNQQPVIKSTIIDETKESPLCDEEALFQKPLVVYNSFDMGNNDRVKDFTKVNTPSIDYLTGLQKDSIVNYKEFQKFVKNFNVDMSEINNSDYEIITMTIDENIKKLKGKHGQFMRQIKYLNSNNEVKLMNILQDDVIQSSYMTKSCLFNDEAIQHMLIDNHQYLLSTIFQQRKKFYVPYSNDEINNIITDLKRNNNNIENEEITQEFV